VGAAVLGPQQQGTMSAIVEGFCHDHEVNQIKASQGRSLYVWGIVDYEDVFGESHMTKFCQNLTWNHDGSIFGLYTPGQNEAN
jgi:hypothetical protein